MKNIKKALSTFLSLSMVISTLVLPMAVQAEVLVIDDHIPGAKNENMIVPDQESYARGFVNGTGSNGGNVSWDKSSGVWSDAAKTRAEVYLEAKDTVTTNAVSGFSGAVYKNRDGSGNVIASRPVYDVNKSYVFSVKAKKMTDQETKLGLSLTNETGGTLSYSKEYGTEGFSLTQEYQDFNVTFKPAAGFTATKQNVLIIGFPAGTEKGAKAAINTSVIDGVYLAEEQAYDITNTQVSGNTKLIAGDTATFKAEVLNQIGLSGYLKQNFTWYVTDKDKTSIAEGITVVVDESTQNAKVTVSDTAVSGEYCVVAVSDYNMARTVKIKVLGKDIYKDYIPSDVKDDNLIAPDQDSRARGFVNGSGTNGGNVSVDRENGGWSNAAKTRTEIYFEAKDTVTTNAVSGFSGMVYKNRDGSGNVIASRPVYDVNKSYVFSIRAKKMTDQETKLGMSLTNEAGGSISYTKEYGKDGITLTDEYVRYGMTIKPASGFNKDKANVLVFGMPAGIETGAKAALDTSELESVYLAEEKAYDINVKKVSGADKLSSTGEAVYSAEIINQVGVSGYLNQTFMWYAMNTARTAFVEGITVTPSADTKTATVTVDEDAVSGEYAIVAVSDIYGMAKGASVKVLKPEQKIYVDAVMGNDLNSATSDSPLATLNGAKEFIRKQSKDYRYTVIFNEGTYYFDNTVLFTSSDSGAEDEEVIYKAADGAKVVFSGGKKIALSAAKQVTDKEILSRLYPQVRDKVIEIDLMEQGFPYELSEETWNHTPAGGITYGSEYVDLYLNGEEQSIAQWPNGDGNYTKFVGAIDKDTFRYREDIPSRWTQAKDWWVGGYFQWDYLYVRHPVAKINTTTRTIDLARQETSASYDLGQASSSRISQRWKAFNLLEEIDIPGEWYIDRDTMKLYYYKPEGASGDLEISALRNEMVSFRNSKYIKFEGIEFTHTRQNVVRLQDVESIAFDGCTFRDIEAGAIYNVGSKKAETDKTYWQRQNVDSAYNCVIENCVFDNVGGFAVQMEGGNVDTLKPGNNVIKNNIIYRCCQNTKNNDVLRIYGCGNVVVNNNISKCPFQAIRTMGNNHIIKYNEIHDVVQESGDSGAVYAGRNTIARGTEIAYNYLHDLWAVDEVPYLHQPAIYWDDSQCGMYAHHNIIRNAHADLFSAGADNTYEYNTVIDVDKFMYYNQANASANTTDGNSTGLTYIHPPV